MSNKEIRLSALLDNIGEPFWTDKSRRRSLNQFLIAYELLRKRIAKMESTLEHGHPLSDSDVELLTADYPTKFDQIISKAFKLDIPNDSRSWKCIDRLIDGLRNSWDNLRATIPHNNHNVDDNDKTSQFNANNDFDGERNIFPEDRSDDLSKISSDPREIDMKYASIEFFPNGSLFDDWDNSELESEASRSHVTFTTSVDTTIDIVTTSVLSDGLELPKEIETEDIIKDEGDSSIIDSNIKTSTIILPDDIPKDICKDETDSPTNITTLPGQIITVSPTQSIENISKDETNSSTDSNIPIATLPDDITKITLTNSIEDISKDYGNSLGYFNILPSTIPGNNSEKTPKVTPRGLIENNSKDEKNSSNDRNILYSTPITTNPEKSLNVTAGGLINNISKDEGYSSVNSNTPPSKPNKPEKITEAASNDSSESLNGTNDEVTTLHLTDNEEFGSENEFGSKIEQNFVFENLSYNHEERKKSKTKKRMFKHKKSSIREHWQKSDVTKSDKSMKIKDKFLIVIFLLFGFYLMFSLSPQEHGIKPI